MTATTADAPRRSHVVGACIVSAAGSLPLHLMSFMVALAAAEGRLSVTQAGWISSCFMVGIMVSTVGLPLLGFQRVTVAWPAGAIVMLQLALWLGVSEGPMFLLGGWVLIGAICGVLHFLGSTSAASYPDRHFVFGLRLALVMFAAAAVIGSAGAVGGFGSYALAAGVLAGGFAVACLLGLVWYRPPQTMARSVSPRPATRSTGDSERWHGLLIAVLFFAGQPGFAAYAAHIALSNGIAADGLPAVYAVCKALGAAVLMKWGASARSGAPTLRMGVALGAGIVAMACAQELWLFGLGLLLWEMAVNVQSTRLQAMVVGHSPALGGLWLPAALATGAGLGPALHGALIGQAAGSWFVAYSVLSGLLPAAWILHRARAHTAPGSSS